MKKLSDTIFILIILIIIGGVGLFVMNPSLYEFSSVRDKQRITDIEIVKSAVTTAQKAGVSLTTIPTSNSCLTEKRAEICRTAATNCDGLVDLSVLTRNNYLVAIPTDPTGINEQGSGYNIIKDDQGRIIVCAPFAETH